jgi:hypothetical protein
MNEERMARGERVHRYDAPPDLMFRAVSGNGGFLDRLHQAPGGPARRF